MIVKGQVTPWYILLQDSGASSYYPEPQLTSSSAWGATLLNGLVPYLHTTGVSVWGANTAVELERVLCLA